MTRHYITIAVVSLIVVAAMVYGFFAIGTPWESRARKFDQERVSDVRSLKTKIDNYYSKNKKLPASLSGLSLSSYDSNKAVDPETGKEYEYSTTGPHTYKLCANFATASDKEKDPYRYYEEKYEHPKGYHCFNSEISSYLKKSASTSTTSTQKTTTFKDENIKSVTTNASKIQSFSTINFPYGFFSSNKNEWGMINYATEPVIITITFKEPVKLKRITNTLTHCGETNCYSWSAKGTTTKNNVLTIVDSHVVKTDKAIESLKYLATQEIKSDEEFNKIQITVTRLKGENKYVHWMKITFQYK